MLSQDNHHRSMFFAYRNAERFLGIISQNGINIIDLVFASRGVDDLLFLDQCKIIHALERIILSLLQID